MSGHGTCCVCDRLCTPPHDVCDGCLEAERVPVEELVEAAYAAGECDDGERWLVGDANGPGGVGRR